MDRTKPFVRESARSPRVKLFALVLGFFAAQFPCTSIPKCNAETGVAGGTSSPRQGFALQKLPGVNDGHRIPVVTVAAQSRLDRTGIAPVSKEVQSQPGPKRNSPQPAQILLASSAQHSMENIPPGMPAPNSTESLTLADLENIALANNPTLVQASARIQAAEGRWLQGGLRPNPIFGYQATEVGNEGRGGQQGAFYSQEFVRGGKLDLNRTVASREIAQAQQQMAAQRLRVLNDVRIEYFNVLVAQRALELTRELADIGQRGLKMTEQLFQGEQVSNAEVLQARIESASAVITLQNAQNRHAAAWRRLSSVVGAREISVQALSGNLTPEPGELDWNESYTRIIAQSPELATARAGVSRAQAILERARIEPRPNVDVQLGVQYDNASQFTIGNIQMGIPIPYSNRNQGNIQTAFADLRNAQADVGRVELSLRNRLALAYENYANARNQVDTFSRQILPDARASLELVSSGFQQQQFDFLTLLTAQRTYSQANLAYLQSLQELNANHIAIEGLLLTGSLQSDRESIDVPGLSGGIAPVFGPGKPPVERN